MSEKQDDERLIVSRPGAVVWCLGGMPLILSLVGLLSLSSSSKFAPIIGWLLFLIFGGVTFSVVLYALRSRITLSNDGIRWQNRTGKHFARWEEVADFYEVREDAKGIDQYYVVRTNDGREYRFDALWTQYARLRALIAERATGANKARLLNEQREWATLRTRPADLPQTFSYNGKMLRRKHRLEVFGLVFMAALAVAVAFVAVHAPIFWILSPLVLGGALFHFATEGKPVRESIARAKRRESFTATTDGLTFSNEGETHKVTWHDIVGYGYEPRLGYIIRTVHGRTFTANPLISRYAQFTEVLYRFATEGVLLSLHRNDADDLAGIAARWTGGVEGVGDRVFHHRTRSGLVTLVSSCLIPLTFSIPLLANRLKPTADKTPSFLLFVLPLSVLPALYNLWQYWSAKYVVSRDGITAQFPLRTVSLRWTDIVRHEIKPYQIYLEAADGKNMNISVGPLAYGSELEPLVIEYLRQANTPAELPAVNTEKTETLTRQTDASPEAVLVRPTAGNR
jgi:hypothetical protein